MGYKELIESLQKEAEEKIRLQWQDAEAEAEKIRTGISGRIEQMREEYGIQQRGAQKNEEKRILSEANRKAREIRLLAENTLSDRLFLLALSCLPELRNDGYGGTFESLVKELPDAQWNEVRVHPEDVQLAEKYFAGAHPVPDNSITGGFLVLTDDRNILINNTFEKRLERIWEEIIPMLIKDTVKGNSQYGTSSAT